MSKRKDTSEEAGIIIVRQMAKHGWIFGFPRITQEVDDQLRTAIDELSINVRIAKQMLTRLIRKYPEHLDAYHRLALAWYRQGKLAKAAEIWRAGTEFALKLFPANFSMRRDRLVWGFIENRPFLRLYEGHGIALLRMGQTQEALDVLENLLAMNPIDNQGVRGQLVECYFDLKRPKAVLALCRRYKGDAMEHLAYGRPLALFQLGRFPEAERALGRAKRCFPLIAEELVKRTHKRPTNWDDSRITMGGPDQAYSYWKQQGKFWEDTPGAISFLKQVIARS